MLRGTLLILLVGAVSIIAACSTMKQKPKDFVVYQAPPVPASFDLEVSPGRTHMYRVEDKEYSVDDLKRLIKKNLLSSLNPYAVLLRDGGGEDVYTLLCFSIIAYDTKMAAYHVFQGDIVPVKLTISGNRAKMGLYIWRDTCSRR